MEYQETYHGQEFVITTLQLSTGEWESKAELLGSGGRTPLGESSGKRYPSEEQARSGALSIAAGAIDQSRISRGKP